MAGRLKRKLISKRKQSVGKETIVGKVRYHRKVYSHNLENFRDFFVWLPPSYNKYREKSYPVLYMQDGQNLIDPKTSFSGKDWRVDETVTRLIKNHKLKEIIIVGVYNTDDRLEEYSDTEKGRKYLKFLKDEVKPFVDTNYRTLSDRKNTAVIGSSMGGLISFIVAWKHPDVFSMVGCLSSSFYYNDEKVFKMIDEYKGPKLNLKFYIDHGEDGLVRGQRMFCKLTQLGYVIGSDLDYYYAPGAEHHENDWAERIERPLLFFFKK
jgi:predicted alpha/beta superfamily hydrolase